MSLSRSLPSELAPLAALAFDLRWTWSHGGDALWRELDADLWERTGNPAFLLDNVPRARLDELAADQRFCARVGALAAERQAYLAAPPAFATGGDPLAGGAVAYFSMEFGLGEAIPLYAGGLGVLAGDYLKAASDLGLPLVGIGILFQEGYFRQALDASNRQLEAYTYNDPAVLPLEPVRGPDEARLRITVQLPGRALWLRVWRARVGRVDLYLLDANDPLNSAADRGLTNKLYAGVPEQRLFQEIVLGVGGWRLLETMGIGATIAHLNEGHTAFAVLERARQCMARMPLSFHEALWATRAGNIFTTHTPVAAGFEAYAPALMEKYHGYLEWYAGSLGISVRDLLALGRARPDDPAEPFNLAYLAARGCAQINAVSRRHEEVSRGILAPMYPEWPWSEVPVTHVTNGVHVPSWDSAAADALWTRACGKDRWLGPQCPADGIAAVADAELWQMRAEARKTLVAFARERLAGQIERRLGRAAATALAQQVLDPNILTLGLARRFAEYKRPTLLLREPERLARLLSDPLRPVQLLVAGKAHPADAGGKALIAEWLAFAARPDVRHRVVFLEDYDIGLAEHLVPGVDVWINTPRPPWEASGTSGMKVLVNGGLNLSQLDGWWAEAFAPEVGWAVGDMHRITTDAEDGAQLYAVLEQQVIPEFYERDAEGLPRRWIGRMRASMARLTPAFSAGRMLREYVDRLYQPGAKLLRERQAQGARLARELAGWQRELSAHWEELRFVGLIETRTTRGWTFSATVQLGAVRSETIRLELYADADSGEPAQTVPMQCVSAGDGQGGGAVYRAEVVTGRPARHFTPRIVPCHPAALVPAELPLILWRR